MRHKLENQNLHITEGLSLAWYATNNTLPTHFAKNLTENYSNTVLTYKKLLVVLLELM